MNEGAPTTPEESASPDDKRVEDDGRMSLPDAQEEANMLRVEMGQNSHDGTVKKYNSDKSWIRGSINHPGEYHVEERDHVYDNVKPTPKDYDQALKTVEDLKKAAEEETDKEKLAYKIGRIINNIAMPIKHAMDSAFSSQILVHGSYENMVRARDFDMHKFDDATYKLEQLKKDADKLGEVQKKLEDLDDNSEKAA